MFILRITNKLGMKKIFISSSYNKIDKYIHDNFKNVGKMNELTYTGTYDDEEFLFQIELCEVLE